MLKWRGLWTLHGASRARADDSETSMALAPQLTRDLLSCFVVDGCYCHIRAPPRRARGTRDYRLRGGLRADLSSPATRGHGCPFSG
eukprot:7900990-Pyramimonas_sp.AAC.1